MGCCDNKKCCEGKNGPKRRIPWLGTAIAILAVLVVVNWH